MYRLKLKTFMLVMLVLPLTLVAGGSDNTEHDLRVHLDLHEDAFVQSGDLTARVTITNQGSCSVSIEPALVFSVRALSHYESATAHWQETSRQEVVLQPSVQMTMQVNLRDIFWRTERDMLRSARLEPYKRLTDILPRGKYSVTCAAAIRQASESKPTSFEIGSDSAEFSVPFDFGYKIDRIRKTLADPNATRESVTVALDQARTWKASEVLDQICQRLLADQDEQIRMLCAHSLFWIADDAAVPHLIEGLRDSSSHVREKCWEALIDLAPERYENRYEFWREWWVRSGNRQLRSAWGAPSNNLQMRITTSRTDYYQGEDITVHVMFRNVYSPQVFLPAAESESPEANAETAFFDLIVVNQTGTPVALVKPRAKLEMCGITNYGVSFGHMPKHELSLGKWKIRTEAGDLNFTDVPGTYTLRVTFCPIHSDRKLWKGKVESNPLTISILAR
jgi:hypothetical protein